MAEIIDSLEIVLGSESLQHLLLFSFVFYIANWPERYLKTSAISVWLNQEQKDIFFTELCDRNNVE